MNKLDPHTNRSLGRPFPEHTRADCRQISDTSLELLECVGVRLYSEKAIQLLVKSGARPVEGNLVRIPGKMVEKALRAAPQTITLFNRKGDPVLPLDGRRSFFGPGSDCLNLLDFRTGVRRRPLLKDLEEGLTLCDALPNVDFVMSLLLPSDVDGTIADRYQMQTMLSTTSKPILFVTYEFQGCLDAVEMLEAVVGPGELTQKPMAACYINVPSGLVHNEDSLHKLLYLSAKGVPCLYIPSSAGGIKSPVTPAGSVAFDYAGVLVGVVLSQLQREGAAIIVPSMTGGTFDMRTLVSSYCEPERTLGHSLARLYGLPMFGLGGASESKTADGQAAAEVALTLLVEVLAGSHLIHDLGYLESGLTFSFSQLLLCDEIVGWIKALIRPTEVSSRTLAVDVIKQVGPDGQFLDTEHTLKYFRERWYPNLFDRSSYDSWRQRGGKDLNLRAAERIDRILAEHKPEPLPPQVQERLHSIVRAAENRL